MTSAPRTITREQLLGTWKLLSYSRELRPSGETSDMMGKTPAGYLNYCADGRMLVLMVRDGRSKPAAVKAAADEAEQLFRGMVAYGGTWRLEDGRLFHHVDISWNETWTDTQQERSVQYDGRCMTLVAGPNPDPVDGLLSIRRLKWEKAGAV